MENQAAAYASDVTYIRVAVLLELRFIYYLFNLFIKVYMATSFFFSFRLF